MPGIIGKKVGMTRVFNDAGAAVSVTVIEAGTVPDRAGQERRGGWVPRGAAWLRREESQAHDQGRGGTCRQGRPRSRALDHSGVPRSGKVRSTSLGPAVTVDIFEAGDRVAVTGNSKGKGFQGVVKRHGFAGRPASHGHPAVPGTPVRWAPAPIRPASSRAKSCPGRPVTYAERFAISRWSEWPPSGACSS